MASASNSPEASASNSPELDKLQADIAAVRDDLAALTSLYKEKLKDGADSVASRVRDGAEKTAADVGARARDGAAVVSDQIEARPLTSVLIAFGVGMALGKIISRD